MTGRMSMTGKTVYTFAVSQNGQFTGTVVDGDLVKMGFDVPRVSELFSVVLNAYVFDQC